MAKKPMSAPGVTGGERTKRSPIAPLGQGPSGTPTDDFSVREVQKGALRPRGTAVGGSDEALGVKGVRDRSATNASAQFRITSKMPGPTSPEASATLANGRVMPSVLGSKQNFIRGGATYGPLG